MIAVLSRLFSGASGAIALFDPNTGQELVSTDMTELAVFAASLGDPWVDLVTNEGKATGLFVPGDGRLAEPAPSVLLDDGMIYLIDGDSVTDQDQGVHVCPLSKLRELDQLAHYSADVVVETPASQIKITLSHGRRRDEGAGRWKAKTSTFAAFSDFLQCHQEGTKDGPGFLQGEAAGGTRKASAMIANHVLGVDLDCGVALGDLVDTIVEAGLEAVIYTTHSHMKDMTAINRDHYLKWSDGAAPTPRGVANHLRTVKHILAEIVADVEILDDAHHAEDGIMIVVRHAPIPKYRVILPLKKPFIFAQRGGTQQDAIREWKERYAGFCAKLGLPFDESCVDPARLFYFPRHPKGAVKFGVWRVVGKPLDLDAYDRVKLLRGKHGQRPAEPADIFTDAAGGAGGMLSVVTAGGFDLRAWAGRHANRFEIETMLSELLDGDQLREPRAGGKPGIHVACPFEHEHSSHGGNGTYVVNASDSIDEGYGGFMFHCNHNACAGRDRLGFLKALIDDRLIGTADLTDPRFLIEIEDEDDEPDQTVTSSAKPAAADPTFKGKSKAEIEHLLALNAKHAVVKMGDKVRVLVEPVLPNLMPTYPTVHDAGHLEAARIVKVKGQGGETRELKMFNEWLKWPGRREYEKVRFAPGSNDPRVYNLFKGWTVEPKPGDWSLLREHLLQVICQGNVDQFDWLLTWLAHLFQRPREKPGVAVVIRGEKGTGKSIVFDFLHALLEPYFFKAADGKRALANFNAAYEKTLLLVMEEAFWAGDQGRESILKDLITGKSLPIERKGVDSYMADNYMRIAMLSNAGWVIPATHDERRFAIFDCGNQYRGDLHYFERLVDQMENGGAAAMLHDLLAYVPADGWSILRKPPRTSGLQQQIVESLRGMDRFFYDLAASGIYECDALEAGAILLSEDQETEIVLRDLRTALNDYLRDHYAADKKATYDLIERRVVYWFGARTIRYPGKQNTNRWVIIPPLARICEHIRTSKGIEIEPAADER